MQSEPRLTLDIVSDVICPWCFIGKRRLEKALAMLGPDSGIAVRWRPFELNPGMPRQGVERRAYRSAKFGSWERSQAMDRQVEMAGAPDGVTFRHDLMERTPNSFDAHRLMWLAGTVPGRTGLQDRLAEILFRFYFQEGRDVGAHEILADAASEAGLDRAEAAAFLAGDEGRDEVARELEAARGMDITGVPTFVIDGRPLMSGAQPPEFLAMALRQATGLRPERGA